jgi:octanoyl-[GcvH]:protein N-octanoyltransferase
MAAAPRLALVRDGATGRAALDVAIAQALLERVASGEEPPALRIYRPAPTVAFGRLDAVRPGFRAAADAARAHGFEPVLRGPGGTATAYHRDSLVLDLVVADDDPITGVQARFAQQAGVIAAALRSLGVDARVGAVAGEHCPGAHSVNAGGRTKLVGTAQRIVRRAWLFSASLVVRDLGPVRDVLEAVYDRLARDWDPATAGAVADSLGEVAVGDVEQALLDAFAERHTLAEGRLDAATLDAARARVHRHVLP